MIGENGLAAKLLFYSLVAIMGGAHAGDSYAAVAPKATEAEAVRFLQQASWGPNKATMQRVQLQGIAAWIDGQLRARPKAYPNLRFYPESQPANCVDNCARDNYTYYQLQKHFFTNALTGQDQLRQRAAFALSQIFVTAQGAVPMPAWMRTYQQLLYDNAFGNYRELLFDIALTPAMGRYLDMLNNRCQTPVPANVNICRNGSIAQPNENFAREILQLFSIGTFMMNQDGTYQTDGAGQPIPTYDQAKVEEFARVFTGWVLAPPLRGVGGEVPNYKLPMVVRRNSQNQEMHHDRGAKTLLNGAVIPAGTDAEVELNLAIDNIVSHANVAPFISKQLIRHLVTANPSPAYVGRIAAIFSANLNSADQLGVVIKAILMDPEARTLPDSAVDPDAGKLNEPVVFMLNFLRAFEAKSDGVLNGGSRGSAAMNQDVFRSPTVFNYYPAEYEVPGEPNLVGPVFGIFSTQTTITRANFINQVLFSGIPVSLPNTPKGTALTLKIWEDLGDTPVDLVDRLSCWMLHCTMSQEMKTIIVNAVNTVPATNLLLRAQTAIYLVATSNHYQVLR
ncbi:MAG: DUF1800 domain-containing protein [Candidatus Binatia bacterium]